MGADGSCPSCGHAIVEPTPAPRAPWHFKLMIAAVALYLGWRVVEAVIWLIERVL